MVNDLPDDVADGHAFAAARFCMVQQHQWAILDSNQVQQPREMPGFTGRRPESAAIGAAHDQRLVTIQEVWDQIPEDVKSKITELALASLKLGD